MDCMGVLIIKCKIDTGPRKNQDCCSNVLQLLLCVILFPPHPTSFCLQLMDLPPFAWFLSSFTGYRFGVRVDDSSFCSKDKAKQNPVWSLLLSVLWTDSPVILVCMCRGFFHQLAQAKQLLLVLQLQNLNLCKWTEMIRTSHSVRIAALWVLNNWEKKHYFY